MESCRKYQFRKMTENENVEILSFFPIICLESVNYLIKINNTIKVNFIDLAIRCAEYCLRKQLFSQIYFSNDKISWLCSCVNSIFIFVKYFILDDKPLPLISLDCLKSTLSNTKTLSAGHACYQISSLILWIEKCMNVDNAVISKTLLDSLKSIIIALSRTPLLNSFALTPPSYLKVTEDAQLFGNFATQVAPLPIKYLQEVDILEEFIFRYLQINMFIKIVKIIIAE